MLGDRKPGFADLKELKFTTRVINESMRLYPQPPVLIRRALEADNFAGYEVPAGSDIFISVWNLHRSVDGFRIHGNEVHAVRQDGCICQLCS